jgi:hypothetical protein
MEHPDNRASELHRASLNAHTTRSIAITYVSLDLVRLAQQGIHPLLEHVELVLGVEAAEALHLMIRVMTNEGDEWFVSQEDREAEDRQDGRKGRCTRS